MIPKPENVATPFTATLVAVPNTVPLLRVAVTVALESTVLPPESFIVITGCVLNAAPDVAPAAEVVTTRFVAAPAVGAIV